MGKAKTRILAEINGQDKRILSIREDGGGRLIINTHLYLLIATPDGKITGARNLEHRHSVHTSAQSASKAITIHKTTTRSDGTRYDRHMLTHAVRDGNFQPVEVRTVVGLEHAPRFKPRPGDRTIRLPAYNTATHTLHYGLWICGASRAEDFPTPTACSVTVAKFRRFAIVVPYCFTPRPTQIAGACIDFHTSSRERLTPEEYEAGHREGLANGVASFQAEITLVRDFNRLIRSTWHPGLELFRTQAVIKPEFPAFTPIP